MKIKKKLIAITVVIFASIGNCLADDAFINAAGAGNILYIKSAIKHRVNLNQGSTKAPHFTALHNAAQRGQIKIVTTLIDAGASVHATDERGKTPLMYAASVQNNLEVIAKLIAAGADPNALSKQDETALFFAVTSGDLETIAALVKAGADVNKQMEQAKAVAKMTALHHAALSGSVHCVQALLEAGALPNMQLEARMSGNNIASGDTALHCATCKNANPRIIGALVLSGADPNLRNNNNQTSLERVMDNINLQALYKKAFIRHLLLAGAEIPEHLKARPLIKKILEENDRIKEKIA